MARFCSHCGSALNLETGLCPRCVSDDPTIRLDSPVQSAAAPAAPVPADEDATVRVAPVPAQEDIDATVRVSPVPVAGVAEDIEATTRVNRAPVQDIDATTRVNRAPVQDADATTRVNRTPVQDADATTRVNPAPVQDADATTRVNPAPAPRQPVAPPPSTSYTQVYQEATPAPKKKKSVGSVIATVFLAISMFIFLLASTVLISIRHFTSQEVLTDTFSKLEFSDVMDAVVEIDNEAEENGGDLLIQKDTIEIYQKDQNGNLIRDAMGNPLVEKQSNIVKDEDFDRTFYENIIKQVQSMENVGDIGLSHKKVEKLLNESTVMTTLAELASMYISDILNNTKEFDDIEDKIYEFLEENDDIIEDEFDIRLSNYKNGRKNTVLSGLADAIVPDDIEEYSPKELKKDNADIFGIVQLCFNWLVIIGLILLAALIVFLMIKNDLSQAAMGGGIVCLLIGGVFTLAGLVSLVAPGVLESLTGNVLLGTLVGSFFTSNLLMFGIIFGVGIISLVVRAIVRKYKGL